MRDHVRVPEVAFFFLSPTEGGRDFIPVGITIDGKNIGSSNFLTAFSYVSDLSKEDASDSAKVSFTFNTTNVDFTPFKKGIRFAVLWGYRGEGKQVADMVIDKATGRYTKNGYALDLEMIPSIAYADAMSTGEDLEDFMLKAHGSMSYRYYNSFTGQAVEAVFIPDGENSRWESVKANLIDLNKPKDQDRGKVAERKREHERKKRLSGRVTPDSPINEEFLANPVAFGSVYNPYTANHITSESVMQYVSDGLMKYLALRGIKMGKKNNSFTLAGDIAEAEPSMGFSVNLAAPGPGLFKPIRFSWKSGEDEDPSDTEAQIKVNVMDPDNGTVDEIDIAQEWVFQDPHNEEVFEEFNIVKRDGRFFYDLDDSVPVDEQTPLSVEEIAEFKKLKIQTDYRKYESGKTQAQLKSGDYRELPPGSHPRELKTTFDSFHDVAGMWENNTKYSQYNNPPYSFPMQAGPYDTRGPLTFPGTPSRQHSGFQALTEFSFEKRRGRAFANTFYKRDFLTGDLAKVVAKASAQVVNGLMNRLECSLTIEGNTFLEAHFNFMVMGAGGGVIGKYYGNKVTHDIKGGSYVTTIEGKKYPPEIKTIVDKIRKEAGETYRDLEERYNLLEDLGRFHHELSSRQTLASFNMGYDVEDYLQTNMGALGITVEKFSLRKFDPYNMDVNRVSTNHYVADSEEDFQDLINNPERLEGARSWEIGVYEGWDKNQYPDPGNTVPPPFRALRNILAPQDLPFRDARDLPAWGDFPLRKEFDFTPDQSSTIPSQFNQ